MDQTLTAVAITAAFLGVIHTITGPDHYVPFIFLSRARNWSISKTLLITSICGIGHILSSVVLSFIGIGIGIGTRANIAAYTMLAFGVLYLIWGVWRAYKNKPHKHIHLHNGGILHDHDHTHRGDHDHMHKGEKATNITPWVLFVIFVFGPCEVLIPQVIYPASKFDVGGLILVVSAFAITTILTMVVVVYLLSKGYKLVKLGKMERYTHIIAGTTIILSAVAILWLGL